MTNNDVDRLFEYFNYISREESRGSNMELLLGNADVTGVVSLDI